MASSPVITGAPSRAPSNIVSFPCDQLSRLRLQLVRCHNRRMLDRWTDELRQHRSSLPEPVYAGMVAAGAARAFRLSVGER